MEEVEEGDGMIAAERLMPRLAEAKFCELISAPMIAWSFETKGLLARSVETCPWASMRSRAWRFYNGNVSARMSRTREQEVLTLLTPA